MTDESVDPLTADNIETNPSRPSQATLDAAAGKTDTKTDGVTPEPIAPEPVQADPAPAKDDATTYMVLANVDGNWDLVGQNITGRSAEAAIRIYAEKAKPDAENGLTLVAIPARSWKPVTVTTKTTTTLVLGEPS